MKNKLNEAFDNVDEKYVKQTENAPSGGRVLRIALIAAALVAIIVASFALGAFFRRGKETVPPVTGPAQDTGADESYEPFKGENGNYSGAKFVSLADTSAENANAVIKTLGHRSNEYPDQGRLLAPFYDKLYESILKGDKNGVVSPVNIYMALSLLAECADGNSRKQILDVIGVGSMEQLREQSKLIWASNIRDDEYGRSLLANSVWTESGLPLKESCVNYLKNDHFASAFSGTFSDPAYVNALKQWLSDMTNGLLDNSINGLMIPEDTAALLASTLYYKAKWVHEYYETKAGKFNGKSCSFNVKMHEAFIYTGNGFTAYREMLSDGNYMWFFLPDEGVTVSDVLGSGLVSYINRANADHSNRKEYNVTVRMPDFDVDYDKSIKDELAALGITDCMGAGADFSAMTDEPLQLSDILHAARFKADKDGVEGAAYTVAILSNGAPGELDDYDFTLDRPFMFAVEKLGTPLFVGCVNELK